MTPLSRRGFLGVSVAAAAAFTRTARADDASPRDLAVLDFLVDGDRELGRRFTLLVPRHLKKDERVPLVVLLHGLGETGDERLGAYAWLEKYGLGTAYDRLRAPPIERTSKRGDFTAPRLQSLNAELASKPFRGLAFACPFTPNVGRMQNPVRALDGYAAWLADVVIPRARKEAPVFADARRTHLDGCSLGGMIAFEVFARRPDLFGALGGVQSAISVARAPEYAKRLASAIGTPLKPLHLETSDADPFHDANVALSRELDKRAVPNELLVLPGPHDQPWLREAGTIEMLHWHDALGR